jgi:hypothetical protein
MKLIQGLVVIGLAQCPSELHETVLIYMTTVLSQDVMQQEFVYPRWLRTNQDVKDAL